MTNKTMKNLQIALFMLIALVLIALVLIIKWVKHSSPAEKNSTGVSAVSAAFFHLWLMFAIYNTISLSMRGSIKAPMLLADDLNLILKYKFVNLPTPAQYDWKFPGQRQLRLQLGWQHRLWKCCRGKLTRSTRLGSEQAGNWGQLLIFQLFWIYC